MGEARSRTAKATRVVFWCVLYCTFGSLSSVVCKIVLTELPYPTTLTMAHLVVAIVCLRPSLSYFGVRPGPFLSKKVIFWRILPLAAGRALAAVSSQFSLWKVPVSYAHTIKALLPIFTVTLSAIILREKPTLKIWFSLIPIGAGVVIATVTELQFDVVGMLAAFVSTLFFSLQNIYSKKSLKEVNIHHLRLLLLLSEVCALMLAPLWFFGDLWSLTSRIVSHGTFFRWLSMLLVVGLVNLGQSVCAFSVLSFMTPTSYSIVNVTKRILVIVVSLLLLRNPVTLTNVAGMSLAIAGVVLYNMAKLDSRKTEAKESHLPLHTESNPNPLSSGHPESDVPGGELANGHVGHTNTQMMDIHNL